MTQHEGCRHCGNPDTNTDTCEMCVQRIIEHLEDQRREEFL